MWSLAILAPVYTALGFLPVVEPGTEKWGVYVDPGMHVYRLGVA